MTGLSPDIVPRVTQLLLLLSSDHDGEALNAARALGRTLANNGLSFHDLAGALEPPPPSVSYRNQPRSSSRWREPQRWASWQRLRSNEKVLALDAMNR